jgi:hypothetical protein
MPALLEHVAHAAHGVQQLAGEGVVELGAQAAHRHLDHIGVGVEVHVPDLLGQRGARQDLPAPAQQQRQQVELLRGQVQPLLRARGAAGDQVELEVSQVQLGGLCGVAVAGGAPAQQRADARQQFGEGEGLDEVVVGATLQAAHAVLDLVARGEHQHRRGLALGAHRGQHAEAVDARQHHVEQHQVVVAADGQAATVDAVVRDVDHMAVLAQALVQVLGQLDFVFDDQQSHGVNRVQ